MGVWLAAGDDGADVIINAGHLTLRPEARDDALAALRAVRPQSQAEPGCRTYDFGVDVDDDNRVNVFEIYDDMDAFRAHRASDHVAQLYEVLREALAEPPGLQQYEAAETTAAS
jgi:quinol monooxygenase YgiN